MIGTLRRRLVGPISGLIAVCSMLSATPGVPATDTPTIKWTLGVGGDTVLSRRLEQATLRFEDFAYGLGDLIPITSGVDLFFCNLECQIASVGKRMDKGERRSFHFRAQPQMVETLVAAGVDAVTIANNHGMDYGPEALLQTISLCRDHGITIVGGGANASEAAAPGFVTVGDLTIAFVGFHSSFPPMEAGPSTAGLNAVRYQNEERFIDAGRAALQVARHRADVVIFTVHWGPNYREEPTDKQRRIARRVLDLGYDAFIAHSAHQFLGVEIHDGKPIIHDAGNFAVDFRPVEPYWNDRNLIFLIHFDGTAVRAVEGIPIHRVDTQTNLAVGEVARAIGARFTEKSRALGTTVRTTPYGHLIIDVR